MSSIKSHINSFLKSEVFKNISVLTSGTIIAQIIPVALQPILRRYYSPENYGAYSVYISLIGILVVLSSLKYEQAIILPKKRKDGFNIFILSILSNFVLNIFLVISILIWKMEIGNFLQLSKQYTGYLYFVPLGTFLYGFYQSINYFLIREKKFIEISKNKLVRRGFEGFSQISIGYYKNSYGLLIGDLIGHVSNVLIGIWQLSKTKIKKNYLSITKLKYLAIKYKEFPLVNLIPSFMSTCSYFLPVLLINKFYSQEYAGFFDLSKMVLSIPLALIAVSISNVLLQKITECYKQSKSVLKEILPVLFFLIFAAIIEVIIISTLGESLFSFLFSETNSYSGYISEIMVWSYALNFIMSSFSSLFIALNKIKIWSVWQIIYFASIISLILFKNSEFETFLRILVGLEIACYSIYIFLLIYITVNYEKKIINKLNLIDEN